MEDIINKLAEIEAAASHIMEDVSEQKKQLAQQYEEAVQKFDANIDMEIQNRSDTIRQELEIQMKKELENQRNEADQILTRLEAYYTECLSLIHISNILIKEVIPAKQTDRKKITANSLPIGICLKMFGIVINIREGPAEGSIPKANTAGIIASAESIAAIVSKKAVCKEARCV